MKRVLLLLALHLCFAAGVVSASATSAESADRSTFGKLDKEAPSHGSGSIPPGLFKTKKAAQGLDFNSAAKISLVDVVSNADGAHKSLHGGEAQRAESQSAGESLLRADVEVENEAEAGAETEAGGNRLRRLAVIGKDERLAVSAAVMQEYPSRCVGILSSAAGSCTATLFQKDLVVTNRHCLPFDEEGEMDAALFFSTASMQIGYAEGKNVVEVTFARAVWSGPESDWAILQTVGSVGTFVGYLGIDWGTIEDVSGGAGTQVSYIGYGQSFIENKDKPGAHFQCLVRGTYTDPSASVYATHTCDTEAGASGSALLTGLNFDEDTGVILASDEGIFAVGLSWGAVKAAGVNLLVPTGDFFSAFQVAKEWDSVNAGTRRAAASLLAPLFLLLLRLP